MFTDDSGAGCERQDVDNSTTKPQREAQTAEIKECKTLNYRRLGGVISTNGKGLIDSKWDRK